jgi:hypothetical protein
VLRVFRGLLRWFRRKVTPAPERDSHPVGRWRARLTGLAGAVAAGTFGALGWLVGGSTLAVPDLAVSTGLQTAEHGLVLGGMELDVLAGYAIGLVYLLGVIWLYRRLRVGRLGWARARLAARTA